MSFIPFHRPHLAPEDRDAVAAVMDSGFLTMGKEVFAFEDAMAEMHGRRHAIMVNSCTNGHMLVFQYLRRIQEMPAGSLIRIPATTFAGPAFQAIHANLQIDLADTNPRTGASGLAELTDCKETVSIYAPMPYAGIPIESMPALLDHAAKNGAYIIEDCAHSIGAVYANGSLVGGLPTYASIYSFYPTKVLNAVEGGMILTDDDNLADWCRSARLHGVDRPVAGRYHSATSDWRYGLSVIGYKCNPNNLQAAVGRRQLGRLPETLERLAQISARYRAACSMAGLSPIDGQETGNQHLFILRDIDRDKLLQHMRSHNIQCSVHYPPLWEMEAWKTQRHPTLPGAATFAERCVSLPIYAGLTDNEVTQITQALVRYQT